MADKKIEEKTDAKPKKLFLVRAASYNLPSFKIRLKQGDPIPDVISPEGRDACVASGLFGDERDLAQVLAEQERDRRTFGVTEREIAELNQRVGKLEKAVAKLTEDAL